MVELISYIDDIARRLGRDVMYITFDRRVYEGPPESWPARNELIAWCQQHNIETRPCAGFSTSEWENSYAGQLYVDLEYSPENAKFKLLDQHLENPESGTKIEGVHFLLLTYAQSLAVVDD